jgi:hypothetical protein
MKKIAHLSWMSATPTSVAASVGLGLPCNGPSEAIESLILQDGSVQLISSREARYCGNGQEHDRSFFGAGHPEWALMM